MFGYPVQGVLRSRSLCAKPAGGPPRTNSTPNPRATGQLHDPFMLPGIEIRDDLCSEDLWGTKAVACPLQGPTSCGRAASGSSLNVCVLLSMKHPPLGLDGFPLWRVSWAAVGDGSFQQILLKCTLHQRRTIWFPALELLLRISLVWELARIKVGSRLQDHQLLWRPAERCEHLPFQSGGSWWAWPFGEGPQLDS